MFLDDLEGLDDSEASMEEKFDPRPEDENDEEE